MNKRLSKVIIGSILIFLVMIYYELVSSIEENMDISTLYYKDSIGDGFSSLVLYATIGLIFVFFIFLRQDTKLSLTLILRAIPISFLLFFMVYFAEFSALTNHYPHLFVFSLLSNLIIGAAVVVFLLMLYWDSKSVRSIDFWTRWLAIGSTIPWIAIGSIYLLYLIFRILSINLLSILFSNLFPDFGEGGIAGYLTMMTLIAMYVEIRILSIIRGNPDSNILKDYDFVQLIYSNTLNIFTETIAVFCTSLAAIWSISVFVFDQHIDQSEVPLSFVHLTYLLTIPFSLLLSRGATHDKLVNSTNVSNVQSNKNEATI